MRLTRVCTIHGRLPSWTGTCIGCELDRVMHPRPRVVAWGGREQDLQAGSQMDRARALMLYEIARQRRMVDVQFTRIPL